MFKRDKKKINGLSNFIWVACQFSNLVDKEKLKSHLQPILYLLLIKKEVYKRK